MYLAWPIPERFMLGVIRWHVTCMLSLAGHWQDRRALSNHVCAHSVIPMWHVVCLQHLARASSEQSRSTTVLPVNHVIQIPQCLSGFVNHDYSYPIQLIPRGVEYACCPTDQAHIFPQFTCSISHIITFARHKNARFDSKMHGSTQKCPTHMHALPHNSTWSCAKSHNQILMERVFVIIVLGYSPMNFIVNRFIAWKMSLKPPSVFLLLPVMTSSSMSLPGSQEINDVLSSPAFGL